MSTEPANSAEPGGAEPVQQPAGTLPGGASENPLVSLTFGCLGAFLAWGALQAFFPLFTIPAELANLPVPTPEPKFLEQLAAEIQAEHYNAIVLLSLFGVLLGVFLAPRRAPGRSIGIALRNRVVCGAAGGLFGALAALVGIATFEAHTRISSVSPLAKTIRVQGAMFGTLGCGIGLAIGVFSGWRRAVSSLVTGILAGVLAGMLYPFLAGVLLPNSITELLVPRGAVNRLLWLGLAGGLLGILIPSTMLSKRSR